MEANLLRSDGAHKGEAQAAEVDMHAPTRPDDSASLFCPQQSSSCIKFLLEPDADVW